MVIGDALSAPAPPLSLLRLLLVLHVPWDTVSTKTDTMQLLRAPFILWGAVPTPPYPPHDAQPLPLLASSK